MPFLLKNFFIVLLLSMQRINAQNLVLNYSFEKNIPNKTLDKTCAFTGNPNLFNAGVKDWITFEDCTPDLFVYDSSKATCMQFPKPHTGNRMLGLIMYHPKFGVEYGTSYHEFVQAKLAKPMVVGKTYRISFWVYNNDTLGMEHLKFAYGRFGIGKSLCNNNFAFYFNKESASKSEDINNSIVSYGITPQLTLPDIIDTKGKWKKISTEFKADQAYQYFVFGNFLSDSKTQINMPDAERQQINDENQYSKDVTRVTVKRIGYYLFDDFAVIEGTLNASTEPMSSIEKALTFDKKYTFEAQLLFETNKSLINQAGKDVLNNLVAFLTKNPTTRIEIVGYTDAQGSETDNLKLSIARAKSVHDYLIFNHIPSNQLKYSGNGEANPLGDNDTEEGRVKNRRVEIIVL
jgi:OmpA-OmpF porin, OOP family